MKTFRIIESEEYKYDLARVVIHDDELIQPEACLAMDLIQKWGLVAAIPDGEDSAGRTKLRLQTPEELVPRAFATSKLAFDEARKRGLVVKVGPLPEPKLREARTPKKPE